VEKIMPEINKIIGIYHANGGILGELKYITGKFFGSSHCALCDITHSITGKKDAWKQCEENLGIPIKFVHLNERESKLEEYTQNITPCIIGKTSTGYILLVDNEKLEKCKGNVKELESLLLGSLK
jgi:hypothetical protein